MIKGLYASASGMLAGMNRQVALSHNVSNADTPGFKQLLVTMNDYMQTAAYPQLVQSSSLIPVRTDNLPPVLPDYLERLGLNRLRKQGDLGLGVETSNPIVDFSQGALQTTNILTDVALDGEGFFHVRTPDGDFYTRDGRFGRDATGQLVTSQGYLVLDVNNQPITVPEGEMVIGTDGTISVNGTNVAQIGVVAFADPRADLLRENNGLYSAINAPDTTIDVGQVHQGFLEMSNVNAAQVMTQLISVTRSYEANQQLVRVQDDLLGRAIGSLGRS